MTKRIAPRRKARPPGDRKLAVWERDGYRCHYCGKSLQRPYGFILKPDWATVDHLIPRSKGGSNRKANLVTACSRCNHTKADQHAAEFQCVVPAPIAGE